MRCPNPTSKLIEGSEGPLDYANSHSKRKSANIFCVGAHAFKAKQSPEFFTGIDLEMLLRHNCG